MRGQLDLFPHLKPKRKPRRVMMHFQDVGVSPFKDGYQCAWFKCAQCGHETEWMHGYKTKTDVLKGEPCPNCNRSASLIEDDELYQSEQNIGPKIYALMNGRKQPFPVADVVITTPHLDNVCWLKQRFIQSKLICLAFIMLLMCGASGCAYPTPYGKWAQDYRVSAAKTLLNENEGGKHEKN